MPARVRACVRAMSVEKTAKEAQARQRWKHATTMMAWEKTCTNPETRIDPPCGTYDRLRAPKPDVDGHPPPFRSEWQRMRYESGLPQSEASAAWAQLLAHPPSAPLVHVDHGHRLEGAATGGWCMWGDYVCKSENLWRERIETDEGWNEANAQLNRLKRKNSEQGGALYPYEQAELEALQRLLTDRKGQSTGWRVRAHPAKGTRASVLDALEARLEGLYEEHEEAGTDDCQQKKGKLYYNRSGLPDYLPTLPGQMDHVTMEKDFRKGYDNRYTINGSFQVPNQKCGTASAQDGCGGVIFRVFYVEVKQTETSVQCEFNVNSYPGGNESKPTVTVNIAKKCSDASAYAFNRQNYAGQHANQLETVLKGIAKYITQKNAVSKADKLLSSASEGFSNLKGMIPRRAKK